MRPARRFLSLAAAMVAASVLGACGAAGAAGSPPEPGSSAAPGALRVVTSFYPLEFAVRHIGGPHVDVTDLTKPGGEPHDLELSPKEVGKVSKAALVVYLRGFQPAVDTAVDQEAGDRAMDVAPAARLDLVATPADGPQPWPVTGGDSGAKDPHFWLDPQRFAAVATAIAQRLAASDPANAASYASNGRTFTAALTALDGEFRAGLASCTTKDLVTSHAAFGYLSERYGFTQVPITLSPDAEPSAAQLTHVAELVRERHVTTIYAETLGEPAFAETVSNTTGARLATLDPIEGLTSESAGHDYLEVMRSNLAVLRAGQGCS